MLTRNRSVTALMITTVWLINWQSIASAQDVMGPTWELVSVGTTAVTSTFLTEELIEIQHSERRLMRVLNGWMDRSAQFKSVEVSFRCSQLNHVFEVETASCGVLIFESPTRWRVEFNPIAIRRGDLSRYECQSGEQYSLKSGLASVWLRIDDTVYFADQTHKSYSSHAIAPQDANHFTFTSPMYFTALLNAIDFQGHFRFQLRAETQDAYVLMANPVNPRPKQWSWSEISAAFKEFPQLLLGTELAREQITIKINKTTMLPTKIKLGDRSGIDWIMLFDSITPTATAGQNNGTDVKPRVSLDCLQGYIETGK